MCKAVQLASSKPLATCSILLTLQDSSSTFTPPTAPVTPDTPDPGPYFPVVAIVIIVVAVCVVVWAAVFILLKCLQVRSAYLFARDLRVSTVLFSCACLISRAHMYSRSQVYAVHTVYKCTSALKYGCMRYLQNVLVLEPCTYSLLPCAPLCMCVSPGV